MQNIDHNASTPVHVAVGVIRDCNDCVLIALRKKGQHQGGLWEFPGGKVEAGESCQQALIRELHEELGIVAVDFEPLIKIHHVYHDKAVLLDVWFVSSFDGEPTGKEGQSVKWVSAPALSEFHFPAANMPIVKAVQLPSYVGITGDFTDQKDFMFRVHRAINKGIGLLQIRPSDTATLDAKTISEVIDLCRRKKISLVFNSSVANKEYSSESGLHLTSNHLMALSKRPVAKAVLLGASCHNSEQLRQAEIIGVDYVFLSPVNLSSSHTDVAALGWEEFSKLVERTTVPVYALGGVGRQDISRAKACGAQGVAAISDSWL